MYIFDFLKHIYFLANLIKAIIHFIISTNYICWLLTKLVFILLILRPHSDYYKSAVKNKYVWGVLIVWTDNCNCFYIFIQFWMNCTCIMTKGSHKTNIKMISVTCGLVRFELSFFIVFYFCFYFLLPCAIYIFVNKYRGSSFSYIFWYVFLLNYFYLLLNELLYKWKSFKIFYQLTFLPMAKGFRNTFNTFLFVWKTIGFNHNSTS